jgi:hypothetical protein
VSARYISWHEGEKEHLWQPGGGRS